MELVDVVKLRIIRVTESYPGRAFSQPTARPAFFSSARTPETDGRHLKPLHRIRILDRESMLAYYQALLSGIPRPRFTWDFLSNGDIRVKSKDKPTAVKPWRSPTSRSLPVAA